jgi:hypothetical protein
LASARAVATVTAMDLFTWRMTVFDVALAASREGSVH